MHYWVILRRRDGWIHHHDYFLDDLIPQHVIAMTSARFADEQGFCKNCALASHCHVIAEPSGQKYCPILFHDVVKPNWKIRDLL